MTADFKFITDSRANPTGTLRPNADKSVTLDKPSALGFKAFQFSQVFLSETRVRGGILLEASKPVTLPTTDSWRTPPWQARRPEDTMSLARAVIVGSKGIALQDSTYSTRFLEPNFNRYTAAVTPIRFTADEAKATGGLILLTPDDPRGDRSIRFLTNLEPDSIPGWERLGPGRVQRFYYAPGLGNVSKTALSAEEMDALLNGVVIYDNE